MEGHPLEDGELLIHSMYGNLPKVKRLLRQKANVDVRGPNEATPLLLASRNGFPDMVRILLAEGADIEAKTENGATSLLWAVPLESPVAPVIKGIIFSSNNT